MVLFCEERFAQDFQFDRLTQTMHAAMRSAVITPKSFYYFIHRYRYFNDFASGVLSRAESNTHWALDQTFLQALGDYAQLSAQDRHRIHQLPAWLTAIVQALEHPDQGRSGDNIASRLRTLGFQAASEMMGELEHQLLDRVMRYECPWHYVLIHRPATNFKKHCPPTLNDLNLILDQRPELPEQIKAWVYEGYQTLIDLQQRLFREIYRESLELHYLEATVVNPPVERPSNGSRLKI
jgi:hypothetical protein